MIKQDKNYTSPSFDLKYTYEFFSSVALNDVVKFEKAWTQGRNIEGIIEMLVSQFEHALRIEMGFELKTSNEWVYNDQNKA